MEIVSDVVKNKRFLSNWNLKNTLFLHQSIFEFYDPLSQLIYYLQRVTVQKIFAFFLITKKKSKYF